MKKLFLALFCCGFMSTMFAQNAPDTIQIKKSFFGSTFIKNGENLKVKDLLEITKSNPVAYAQMKKARNKNTVSSIFGGVGGFLVGYTIGSAIAGKDVKWAVAGIGAGLIGAGIPFSVNADKYARKAVSNYNQSLQNPTSKTIKLEAVFAANGVGLKLAF